MAYISSLLPIMSTNSILGIYINLIDTFEVVPITKGFGILESDGNDTGINLKLLSYLYGQAFQSNGY